MIHKTSIIDSQAKLSKNIKVGAYSIIGPNVQIGENTIIHPHVVISGNTIIGKNNEIYPFASIGSNPQDLKYNGEQTMLEIGNNNTIREYVTINPGTVGDKGKTVIGNNCLLMISSHIAHDCIIGNNVIIANNVPIAGHVEIGDFVIIGGNSAVQQFTRIGKMAMIGGMTGVLNDVIPYGLSIGNRNFLQGLNLIGLRRTDIPNKDILSLSDAYKKIFKTNKLTDNLNNINGAYKKNSLVNDVIEFINKDKKRPICTPFSK
jgi:UDP-N-acetylglucosamine acyltransferase